MNSMNDLNNINNINKPANSPARPTVKQIDLEISRIENSRELRKAVAGTLKNIVVIAAAAIIAANLFIAVLIINKNSMSPILQDGDIVVAVRWGGVNPGDVAAFYYNNKILLKRVIAKAGDWVYIDENGTVFVNDEALDEPYVAEKSFGECDIDLPYQVPDGSYFVMGDQRKTSADSRLKEIGPVGAEYIAGKVFVRIWPLSKIELFG